MLSHSRSCCTPLLLLLGSPSRAFFSPPRVSRRAPARPASARSPETAPAPPPTPAGSRACGPARTRMVAEKRGARRVSFPSYPWHLYHAQHTQTHTDILSPLSPSLTSIFPVSISRSPFSARDHQWTMSARGVAFCSATRTARRPCPPQPPALPPTSSQSSVPVSSSTLTGLASSPSSSTCPPAATFRRRDSVRVRVRVRVRGGVEGVIQSDDDRTECTTTTLPDDTLLLSHPGQRPRPHPWPGSRGHTTP